MPLVVWPETIGSEAEAERVTDAPETVAPAVGAVMDMVGGVVSGERGIGKLQEAVVPPVQLQRYELPVSGVSNRDPVRHEFMVVPQEPGVRGGGTIPLVYS